MANEKLTELTKVSSGGTGSLFYMVDPNRAAGDQSVSVDKDDVADIIGSGSGGGGNLEYQTVTTTTGTTLDGTQKGLNKVYPFENASAQTITITTGDYVENDVINIERRGQGTVEIIADTGVRIRGVRDVENRYFVNDVNGIVALLCRGSEEFGIIGNLKRGYSGAVTTSNYTALREGDTAVDVVVTGTGFSDNMLVSVSANATLNSFTVQNSTQCTLNLTAVGVEDDTVTVTYDNGDVFVDTNAITIQAASGAFYAEDKFTGTVIDTSIWTIVDADNLISQNNQLEIDLPHTSNQNWNILQTSLKTSVNANSSIVTAQSSIITENIVRDLASGAFGLYRTGSEGTGIYCARFQQGGSVAGGVGVQIITNGSSAYFFDTGIAAASLQNFKIVYDDSITRVYFYHWNGSSWDELDSGTVKTYDLMGVGTLDCFYTLNESTAATSADFTYFDDFYMNNADYSTLTP